MTDYFDQMDKFLTPNEENQFSSPDSKESHLQKPIIPISKLGATFAEKGSGQQTVLQSMVSSIRKGSGSLQLALQTDHNAAMGGGVASISKPQRQAIKEMIAASGIEWQGLELPTSSMSDVSGFDPRQKQFSEQKRQNHLRAIKDAIDFNGDLGFGGGVDIWSQEFSRDITTAEFNKKNDVKFVDFEGFDENKDANKILVDKRSGQLIAINTGMLGGNGPTMSVPVWETAKKNTVGPNGAPITKGDYIDSEGNKLDPKKNIKEFITGRVPLWNEKKGTVETKQMNWEKFKKHAEKRNKESGMDLSPEVWAARTQLENQYAQQKAQIGYHSTQYEQEFKKLRNIDKDFAEAKEQQKEDFKEQEKKVHQQFEETKKRIKAEAPPDKQKEELENLQKQNQEQLNSLKKQKQKLSDNWKKMDEDKKYEKLRLKRHLSHTQDSAAQAQSQATNTWESIDNIRSIDKYGRNKVSKSYAELGLYALEETKKKKTIKAIHVGPELGFPTSYGGHPKEFIAIIQDARKEMIKQMKNDPKYRAQYTDKQLKAKAKEHIAGEFDTAHLNMWYNHFPKKNNHESEDSKLKRFNKWYLKQVEDLAKADVIGGVQVVDTLTGSHRHLPTGQGVFPVVEAVKVLRKHGYKGHFASEGHEEEMTDPGSTQFSLWNALGASVGTSYHFGTAQGGNAFGNIYGGSGGAAGYRVPAGYSFGAYSPSEEFKLWSGTPLE